MRRFRTTIVLALATLFSISICSAQQKISEPYSPVVLANQVMIHAQGEETAFIATVIGVDPSSPLNYSSYVDPSGQSFTFSLNPGSTYLGQPFTLTASGILDPSTQIWNLSTSGSYGDTPWEVTSSLVPSPSPAALVKAYNSAAYLNSGRKTIFHNDIECGFFIAPIGDVWECFFTLNGMIVGGPWNAVWYPGGDAAYSVNVPYWNFSAQAINFTPGQSGAGSFTTVIRPPLTICKDCDVFFSDFSPRGNAYQCCEGWQVSGSGTGGTSFTVATEFLVAKSGSISQIDVAVGYVSGVNSFYAALYTDSGGLPGTELASWSNLSSNTAFGQCCGLVTINGISGLSLNAGTSYFLVLGPMNVNDTSWEEWNLNSIGAKGLNLYSTDGGLTWHSRGQQTLGAFDIF